MRKVLSRARCVVVVVLALVALAVWHGGAAGQRGGGGRGGRGGGISPGIRALVHGRITALDAASGRITVTVEGQSLTARVSPAALATLTRGDDVFLTVELIDPRFDAVAGPVTAVDRASGRVTVRTPSGPWTTAFAPEAIGDVRPGDPVVLKLNFVDVGPPADQPPPAR